MANDDHGADRRLAVYGTLAPGRVNHHEVAELRGLWRQGTVRGVLVESGWGAAMGYPGLTLDAAGPVVDVFVLESDDLPAHWARLDEFEGPGYRRVVTEVQMADGVVRANLYELAPE